MDPAMVKNLALGAVPPFVLALLFFVAAWRRRDASEPRPGTDLRLVAAPLVMAAIVVLTYSIAFQVPRAPTQAFEWFPILAVAAGIAGSVASLERLPAVLRWTPALLALLLGVWAGVRNLIAASWTPELTGAYLLETLVAGIVLLAAGHALVGRRAGLVPVLVLMLFAGAVSQLLVLGLFSMKVGQVAGMTASMLMAAALVALWRPAFRAGTGVMVFVVIMSLATLGQGRVFGQATPEMVRIYASLVVLSLVGAAIVLAGLPDRIGSRLRGLIVVGAAALPLVAGLGLAGKKWIDAENAAEDDPYAEYAP